MEIKITKKGHLYIDEILKTCPFKQIDTHCAINCALFKISKGLHTEVFLCKMTWICKNQNFIDEMPKDRKKLNEKFPGQKQRITSLS